MLLSLRRIGRALLRVPRAVRIGALVLWMALIWTLSAASFGGGESSLGWSWMTNLAHAPLFGILGLLVVAARGGGEGAGGWPRTEGAAGGGVLLFVGFYGLVDELHQSLTPGRDSAWTDLVTDLVGAACVLVIITYLGRPEAVEGGLRRRLAGGILACAGAALIASLV